MAPTLAVQLVAAVDTARSSFVDLDIRFGAWLGLGALIVLLLGIDLYRHRHAHAPSPREAMLESAAWVACGLGFSLVILVVFGSGAFGEYLSGYLTEKALSVDNVFVWSILFSSMAVPVAYQHRVLFWGIFGALVLRGAFIFAGSAILAQFQAMLIVFGLFLLYTGVKLIRHRADEGERGTHAGLGTLSRLMPVSTRLDGQRFFTRVNGKWAATPLLAALVVVEATDLIFAVDSVPAILALSSEEFLIFSSNAFAILGLRALYFLLANARQRFHYLNHALGGILVFVGAKMTVSYWWHLNVWISLAVIMLLLLTAVAFSEQKNRKLRAAENAVTVPS